MSLQNRRQHSRELEEFAFLQIRDDKHPVPAGAETPHPETIRRLTRSGRRFTRDLDHRGDEDRDDAAAAPAHHMSEGLSAKDAPMGAEDLQTAVAGSTRRGDDIPE
jgi:hypothetical protein